MHKPHLAECYHKELIATLQAKGKIPRTMTAADERRERENGNTVARIFPGPFGRDAVLTQMVDKATERIDAVTGRSSSEPRPPGHQGSGKRRDPAARAALTARLSEVEKELAAEREARRKLEQEMDQFRESASRGGA